MKKWSLFIMLLTTTLLAQTDAKTKPSFEFGLGIGSLYYPNYIGSKTTQILTLPLPYIRYRGKYIRIDEDGLSGKLFGINGLRLDVSVSGSLPASSDKDGVRSGMPDLELAGEVGPKLVYNIYEKGVSLLEFELDLRATLSTDFNAIHYRGLNSNPQLKYSLNYSAFEWTFRTGILLSDSVYNDYYYGVASQYVNANRPLYETQNGYSGVRNRVGVTYKKESWWGGAFLSHHDIRGASFEDSPLVETKDSVFFGASIAYIFYEVR